MSKLKKVLALGVIFSIAAGVWFGIRAHSRSGEVAAPDVAEASVPPRAAPINVLLLAPLRGEYQIFGESLQRGVTLAVAEVNDNHGFAGHPLRLHTVDTRSSAEFTLEAARDALQRLKVSLLVGGFEEQAVLGLAELANEAKVPFIYTTDGAMKTCRPGARLKASDYVWGLGISPHMSVEPFLVHLSDKLLKPESKFRIYYFGNDDPEFQDMASFIMSSAENLEFSTVGTELVDRRIGDHFQRIRKVFGSKADVLMLSFNRFSLPQFLAQAAKLGVRAEMGLATVGNLEEEMLGQLGSTADDLRTVTTYTAGLKSPENEKFLAAWKKAHPEGAPRPTATAVAAYSSILLAKAAFDKADSLLPGDFAHAMKDIEMVLPQGSVMMDARNHLLIQPLYAVVAREGRFELDEYLGDVSHPGLEACAIDQGSAQAQASAKEAGSEEIQEEEEDYWEPLDMRRLQIPKFRKPKGHYGEGKRDGSI